MKINVKEITIHWAEGDNKKYDKFPKTYSSYAEVNEALKPIYEDFAEIGEGYNKVKFSLIFEDGETYEGRLYVCQKEDNPTTNENVIGDHITKFLNNIIKNNENEKIDRITANNFINNYQL
jgi:hypothetical protein